MSALQQEQALVAMTVHLNDTFLSEKSPDPFMLKMRTE